MARVSAWACVSGGVRGLASRRRAASSLAGSLARVKPPATSRSTTPRLPSARSSRRTPSASSTWPSLASVASARSAALTGCAERKSRASIVRARSFTAPRPPPPLHLPHDLDRAERLARLPGRLAPPVELEQGEEGDRLGESVLAA